MAYSGTQCHLESISIGQTSGIIWIFIVDMPLSIILDTLVLPYTLLRELWRPHDPDVKLKPWFNKMPKYYRGSPYLNK